MENIQSTLLEFHEKYNLIFDEQSKLPTRKGVKDYSLVEAEVKRLATNLITEISIFKRNNPQYSEYFNQIDNFSDGCYKLIANPYNRVDRRIDLSNFK